MFGSAAAQQSSARVTPAADEKKLILRDSMLTTRTLVPRPVLVKSGRAKRGRRPRSSGVMLPPPIIVGVHTTVRLRFSPTAATAKNINVGNLCAAAGFISTLVAGTSAVCFFSSVRVKSVEIWTEPQNSASVGSELSWGSAGNTIANIPDENINAPSMGSSLVGYKKFIPPAKSIVSDWWTGIASGGATTSQVVFTIASPVGSYVDVTMDVRSCNNNSSQPVSLTIIGGVAQQVYYGALDGPSAAQIYIPVGLPTIT